MPVNVITGDSSGHNYASGRLDHQAYFKSIRVEQSHLEAVVTDRLLDAWFDEAALIPGLLPEGLGPYGTWSHTWMWDGTSHVDPLKEANAQAVRLSNHTTTLADEYARAGTRLGDPDPPAGQGVRVADRARPRAELGHSGMTLPTRRRKRCRRH